MKYKTLRQRLKIYEIVLTEFLLAKEGLDPNDFWDDTKYPYGYFCWYFDETMIPGITSNLVFYGGKILITDALPELCEANHSKNKKAWFPSHDIKSRIKCLQKAIKITENKIKKQEKLYQND